LIFMTISQLGLVFLPFLVGLEFDFSHLRSLGRSALAISIAGIALPFALGVGIAPLILHAPDMPAPRSAQGFTLFLGTALAITALPVLGRMMMEWNITRAKLSAVTISSAAIEDACGWIILAGISAVVKTEFDARASLLMVVWTLVFGLGMLFVVRPLLRRWVRYVLKQGNGDISLTSLALLIAMILGCAAITNVIGIFAIFGAFLLCANLSAERAFREAVARRLHDFVTAFFVPIFFTYTGLRTDIGMLRTPYLWALCGLVLAAAIAGKMLGCGLAARLTGFSTREASLVGTMMNTRGLMELVVINVGKDLGVVPDPLFGMLVLMAVVTTVMTTPLLMWLMPGTELEPYLRGSAR